MLKEKNASQKIKSKPFFNLRKQKKKRDKNPLTCRNNLKDTGFIISLANLIRSQTQKCAIIHLSQHCIGQHAFTSMLTELRSGNVNLTLIGRGVQSPSELQRSSGIGCHFAGQFQWLLQIGYYDLYRILFRTGRQGCKRKSGRWKWWGLLYFVFGHKIWFFKKYVYKKPIQT